jgi:electron transport complex protein RnfG
MDTRGADAPVKRSLRGGLILGAAAVVAFSLVALVHDATRDRIAASERARRVAQFDAVLGGTHHDNDLLADVTYAHDPDLLGTTSRVPVYRARLAGQPVAAVLAPVAPDGYAGSIDLLVAIGADGKVLGVHVLRHHETPGLGDAIEERKSGWIRGFIGRSLADPPLERWKVRKDGGDFDQFTGATVTPRAVVRAVAACLAYFRQHRDELFAAPATMPT